MTLDEAITYYDHNHAKFCRAMGITFTSVTRWKKIGQIPFVWQCQLQVITDGALKADRKDS